MCMDGELCTHKGAYATLAWAYIKPPITSLLLQEFKPTHNTSLRALPSLQTPEGSRVRDSQGEVPNNTKLSVLLIHFCKLCSKFASFVYHNGRPIPAAPLGICLWPPRQRHLLHELPGPNPDVLPDLQEQVDGGLPVGAVRGGALQRHAVDLLRAGQVQRGPPRHHQCRRLRHRDRLHRHVPRLRAEEGQALHRQDPPPPQRRRVRPHPPPHPPPLRGRAARRLPRLGLRRLLRQRLRRAAQHHRACDQDEERGVHALLAVPHAHPQRRRLVPLRPPHQGQIRRAAQHTGILLRNGPDGSVHVLHERDASDQRRGEGGQAAAGGGGARRGKHRQARNCGAGAREEHRLRSGAPGDRDGRRRTPELRGRGGGGGAGRSGAGGRHGPPSRRGGLEPRVCMHGPCMRFNIRTGCSGRSMVT